jgi:carbonic anhydrase
LIFDAGLGDLFVVRVAGNVLSAEVAGSLQYAAAHLGTALFLVLGHEGCGAVQAAVDAMVKGTVQRSRIQILVDNIMPGLSGLDLRLPPKELLSAAVEANVRWTMRQIKETPEARAAMATGRMALAGAVYDLQSGRVRLLA